MQTVFARLRQSSSIKVFTIGFLVLVLLIPLAMVKETVRDRDQVSLEARQDIQQTWGQAQLIAGPVLVLPYESVLSSDNKEHFIRTADRYILADELDIDTALESDVLYRGIHKVPVYSVVSRLSGTIDLADLGPNIDPSTVDWSGAMIAIGVSDGRAIAETPELQANGASIVFIPGGQQIAGLPPQILAPVGELFAGDPPDSIDFDVTLNINGSESLKFLPLGDTTRVTMRSDWASPSFSGNYLPETREVSDDGFTASWKVSSIGRPLPSRWSSNSSAANSALSSAFGVDLYMPISVYRLTLRAAKYGILFIGLTFVGYFMFEVIARLQLHPIQYLMIGLANVLFYLLLVSFAEHTGFGFAYILSALASSGLVIGYSRSVLGDRSRASVIAAILVVLYSFLYMTLKAESYAMLAGSIGLWATLALIMYLTRRINWYSEEEEDDDEPVQHGLLG
jgi:inner membrane protein